MLSIGVPKVSHFVRYIIFPLYERDVQNEVPLFNSNTTIRYDYVFERFRIPTVVINEKIFLQYYYFFSNFNRHMAKIIEFK